MNKFKLAIIEPSYLARTALFWTIREMENVEIVKETGSVAELHSYINDNEVPDFIIISSDHLKEASENEIIRSADPVIIEMSMSSNSDGNDTIIYIGDTKAEINNKLSALLRKELNQSTDGTDELSDREKDVLKLVVRGLINKDIADELFISTHTVISHRKNITSKLGIKTVSGLTVYAILNGIVPMESIK